MVFPSLLLTQWFRFWMANVELFSPHSDFGSLLHPEWSIYQVFLTSKFTLGSMVVKIEAWGDPFLPASFFPVEPLPPILRPSDMERVVERTGFVLEPVPKPGLLSSGGLLEQRQGAWALSDPMKTGPHVHTLHRASLLALPMDSGLSLFYFFG